MTVYADTQADRLTESQNAAIYTIDRSVAVVAGAGSGKTTVLIKRCCQIIGDNFSEIDRMLAITFTDKAAGELRSRLRPYIPPEERYRLESSWTGTFHSCCARILRQHAPLVGLDPAFDILDENASKLIASQIAKNTLLTLLADKNAAGSMLVDALDFKTALGAIEDMLAFRWHATFALSLDAASEPALQQILKSLSEVWSRVAQNLSSHFERIGALDFQELEIKALQLFDEHPEVLEGYRKKFRHILIDEFQDTNDLQTEFVMRLFSPGKNILCIVGDPRQSIYRFRGANTACFTKMLGFIKKQKGSTIDLLENFRSAPGIVDFVNRCQSKLSDGLFGNPACGDVMPEKERMIAARKDFKAGLAVINILHGLPEKTSIACVREAEALSIASYIGNLHDQGMKYGEIVCLFQALTAISPYERAFRIAGIPYLVHGGRGLLNRQEVSDLTAVLSYAADPKDEMAILEILRSPLVGLSDDELTLLAGVNGKSFLENARLDPKCRLLGEIEEMSNHLRPSEILRKTLCLTGFEEICDRLDPSGGMTANLDRFVQIASSIERQEPTPLADYASFIKELKTKSARIGDPPAASDTVNAVRCMTIHAAKGLQFPVVILPDLIRKPKNQGGRWQFSRERGIAFKLKDPEHPFGDRVETQRFESLKCNERESAEAESKRLLYVAMTRARDKLVLPTHTNFRTKNTWHEWLMPHIEDAGFEGEVEIFDAGLTNEGLQPRHHAQAGIRTILANDPVIALDTGPHVFTVTQLECYYRCPEEYRLRYLLGLPSGEVFAERSDRLAANVFGSIVHGVIDELAKKHPADDKTIIRKACIDNSIPPEGKIEAEVMKALEKFRKLPLYEELHLGRHELRFDYLAGKTVVTGSIDWLKPDKTGHEIIDFKTDRIAPGEEDCRAAEYDLQLLCYALAAESSTGKPVTKTSLVFLSTNAISSTPMTDARKEYGRQLTEDIIKNLQERRFDLFERRPPCSKCPYGKREMCTKKTPSG